MRTLWNKFLFSLYGFSVKSFNFSRGVNKLSPLTNIMNTKLLKNTILAAAASMFVASCGTGGSQEGITKSLGDAAVDSVTKDSDIVTKTAVRNATGYGTDPVEEQASGFLNSLTR